MSGGTRQTASSNVHCVRELLPVAAARVIFEACGRSRKKPSPDIKTPSPACAQEGSDGLVASQVPGACILSEPNRPEG